MSALTAGEVDLAVNIPVDFSDKIKSGGSTYLAVKDGAIIPHRSG